MRINWVLSDTYQFDPSVNLELIKGIGPSWGSWKTWRSCSTDNVICHDLSKAKELLGRAFQAVCNFYLPKKFYQDLARPVGVKWYEGDFEHALDQAEDIIGLNLASVQSDLILLTGFDLATISQPEDRFQAHKMRNYHGMILSIIRGNPDVQWVLVDHVADLDKAYQDSPNLTCDSMDSVLKLLS